MNANQKFKSRRRLGAASQGSNRGNLRNFKLKPCWTTFYNLGAEFNQYLVPRCTLAELGRTLGVTEQNAYTESVLALGKLVYFLRESLRGELEETL